MSIGAETKIVNLNAKIFPTNTYLHDEFVKDEEKVGLITHEHSYDVFVVGWVQLLLGRLGQSADQGVDKKLEAFDADLFLVICDIFCFGLFREAKDLSNLTLLQVLIDLDLDKLLSFDQALVNGCNHFENEIYWQGAEDERVALFEGWLEQALGLSMLKIAPIM